MRVGLEDHKMTATLGGESVTFTPIEYRLLKVLVKIFAALIIGLQMLVSFCICKSIAWDTLTERLRTD